MDVFAILPLVIFKSKVSVLGVRLWAAHKLILPVAKVSPNLKLPPIMAAVIVSAQALAATTGGIHTGVNWNPQLGTNHVNHFLVLFRIEHLYKCSKWPQNI